MGFLHSEQFSKPSLIRTFRVALPFLDGRLPASTFQRNKQEGFCHQIRDSAKKREWVKRAYLNDDDSENLIQGLNSLFENEWKFRELNMEINKRLIR